MSTLSDFLVTPLVQLLVRQVAPQGDSWATMRVLLDAVSLGYPCNGISGTSRCYLPRIVGKQRAAEFTSPCEGSW